MENMEFILFFLFSHVPGNWSERKGSNEILFSHHLEQVGIKTFEEQNKTHGKNTENRHCARLALQQKQGLSKYIHSAY